MTTTYTTDVNEESTRAQIRLKIARQVGAKTNPSTPLDKGTLNSVYAHLTGEFVYSPAAENRPRSPEFSPRQEVLLAVVKAADISEQTQRDPDLHNDDWVGAPDDLPSKLRHSELLHLSKRLSNSEDERGWV